MSQGPLEDVVSAQYEQWAYPEPIWDLPGWLQHNWQWFDPSHAHRLMWPDRGYRPRMDILVAGCGTNQAAVLAYTNPDARVTAIDVSETSLSHHRALRERYGLGNLEVNRLPIEAADRLGLDFDLIVSTGVLHHLADPAAGMSILGRLLRRDGVLAVMLYARFGRVGVEMMQSVFRDLGLTQDDASLPIVRDALAHLPEEHPLRSYLPLATDLQVDAGVVDTFLHGRDRSFTVPDCLELVSSAGLVFHDWLLKSGYYPPLPSAGPFFQAVRTLPIEQQWAVMERVNARNACHFFLACRPDRPRSSYAIDFDSSAALEYIPFLRYRCEVSGRDIARPDWRLTLDPLDVALMRRVNGVSTIRQAVAEAARDEGRTSEDLEERARTLLQSLWQRDFVGMGIAPPEAGNG